MITLARPTNLKRALSWCEKDTNATSCDDLPKYVVTLTYLDGQKVEIDRGDPRERLWAESKPQRRSPKRARTDGRIDVAEHRAASARVTIGGTHTSPSGNCGGMTRSDVVGECVWTDRPESAHVLDCIIAWYCEYYASKMPFFGIDDEERREDKTDSWHRTIRPGADPGPLFGVDEDMLDMAFASALVSMGLTCRLFYKRIGAANVRLDMLMSLFVDTIERTREVEIMDTSLYVGRRGPRDRETYLLFDSSAIFIGPHRGDGKYEARYIAHSLRLCGTPISHNGAIYSPDDDGEEKEEMDDDDDDDDTNCPAYRHCQLIVPPLYEVDHDIEWDRPKEDTNPSDDDDGDLIADYDDDEEGDPYATVGLTGSWMVGADDESTWELQIYHDERNAYVVQEVMVEPF
jgi:hypothetical protein